MKLGEFHELISKSLKRGTTLDDLIPTKVAQAALWLERNYNFTYMEKFKLFEIANGDRFVEFPNARIKGVLWIRLLYEDGSILRLLYKDPKSVSNLLQGEPASFYRVGVTGLVVLPVPGQDFAGEAMFIEYTDWPRALDSEHPLLTLANDVLQAQTLMLFAPQLRDPRMFAMYKEVRDEGVRTLIVAEEEMKYGGADFAMEPS